MAILRSRAARAWVSTFVATIALGSAVTLASCTGGGGDAYDQRSDEISAQKNVIGLRLRYDEASRTVRAKLRDPLEPGERLRLRLRRARLSTELLQPVRCDQLADAPAMAGSAPGPSDAGASNVVFQGPVIDPALLVAVYKDEWILAHIASSVLEQLATDGADSIVEACVVGPSEVRARVMTTLPFAWDLADPNVAAHVTALPDE